MFEGGYLTGPGLVSGWEIGCKTLVQCVQGLNEKLCEIGLTSKKHIDNRQASVGFAIPHLPLASSSLPQRRTGSPLESCGRTRSPALPWTAKTKIFTQVSKRAFLSRDLFLFVCELYLITLDYTLYIFSECLSDFRNLKIISGALYNMYECAEGVPAQHHRSQIFVALHLKKVMSNALLRHFVLLTFYVIHRWILE